MGHNQTTCAFLTTNLHLKLGKKWAYYSALWKGMSLFIGIVEPMKGIMTMHVYYNHMCNVDYNLIYNSLMQGLL
jgi:hypothetical protein